MEFQLKNTAVCLGKFDGIHRGHRLLINEILEKKKEGYTAVVFTFSLHPLSLFSDKELELIDTIDEKKDTILPRDTTFLLDLYQFHRDPYYRIKNAPYRYFRDIYVARKDCALLTFCNIPLDDIKKILESLKIYRCVEFFWCDSEREE